jgi:hypothetical protein
MVAFREVVWGSRTVGSVLDMTCSGDASPLSRETSEAGPALSGALP